MKANYRYPIDITSLGAYLIISRYEYGGNQFSTQEMFNVGTFSYTKQMPLANVIALPVPNNIVDSTSAMWRDNYEMGLPQQLVYDKLANKVGSGGIANTIIRNQARQQGYTWAKANVLNYDGTATKVYNFQWVMIPQSKAEADEIEKIADTFENGMLSSISGDNVAQYYPDLFRIQVVGVKRMAFLPCVVESVDLDMSSDGNFQVMGDGNLPQYTLTVQFKEITNRTKETYKAIRQGINI